MPSLSTTYLRLQLRHPFIAGASPFADTVDSARQIEDGGAAAIVLRSLFEEQITMARSGRIAQRDPLDPEFATALAAFPTAEVYSLDPDAYLEQLRRLKSALGIPVIASLNGTTSQAWLSFARDIEQAGADALELNMYYFVSKPSLSSVAVESEAIRIVVAVRSALHIPIAVKLPMFITAPVYFARELHRAGADGLVLFNRVYHPDVDIDTMTLQPKVELSTAAELLPRLVWLPIVRRHVNASLAVTGGVATPADGIKAILVGADAVQLVSAIVRHGPRYFKTMSDGLRQWLDAHAFQSVSEARGRIMAAADDDQELAERGSYLRTLQSGPANWAR